MFNINISFDIGQGKTKEAKVRLGQLIYADLPWQTARTVELDSDMVGSKDGTTITYTSTLDHATGILNQ